MTCELLERRLTRRSVLIGRWYSSTSRQEYVGSSWLEVHRCSGIPCKARFGRAVMHVSSMRAQSPALHLATIKPATEQGLNVAKHARISGCDLALFGSVGTSAGIREWTQCVFGSCAVRKLRGLEVQIVQSQEVPVL